MQKLIEHSKAIVGCSIARWPMTEIGRCAPIVPREGLVDETAERSRSAGKPRHLPLVHPTNEWKG